MLKILHIIDSGGLYGAEQVVLTLMEESLKLGHSPILGCLSDPGLKTKAIESEARRRGLPWRRIHMGTLPGPLSMARILRTIREERIDIVHTHGYKANVLFGFLPRFLRPFAVVSTLHGWCNTKKWSKLRLYEWLDSRAVAFHDRVVAVSAQILEKPALCGRHLSHISVIANAASVDTAMERSSADPDHITDFCQGAFTFCSIGRLSREKNFIDLLRAFEKLRTKNLDIQLLIMGEGYERANLSGFINQQGLVDRVLMPGYVSDAPQYLRFAGAYVLSSTTEGMPISIIEAMASGLPIVATAVGEVPDMLGRGDAGVLVAPGDVPGLAAAMESVYSDLERSTQLAGEAKRIADQRFSAASMALAYINVYRRALEGSVRRR